MRKRVARFSRLNSNLGFKRNCRNVLPLYSPAGILHDDSTAPFVRVLKGRLTQSKVLG